MTEPTLLRHTYPNSEGIKVQDVDNAKHHWHDADKEKTENEWKSKSEVPGESIGPLNLLHRWSIVGLWVQIGELK